MPTFFAVTTPSSTVATVASEVVQVTVLSVASSGLTVAVRVTVSPAFKEALVLSSVIDVTGRNFESTVTVQVAVLPPSFVVTVMMAVPADFAVISPFSSTDATSGLSLLHSTLLSVASSGDTVATRVTFSSSMRVSSFLSRATLVTWINVFPF